MASNQVGHVTVVLYVKDQSAARDFYVSVLGSQPTLDVPGMTEFVLLPGVTLGLMPEHGIASLISPPLTHPSDGAGIPRCELYLRVRDVDACYAQALEAGAQEVSAPASRDWGERVGYLSDSDGHVLAFAQSE
ncbi:MAG: VOC family protein [Agrococcus casei]|uniref:VOC family protein n=1 Tax=Agrococcus casei TaxID=343512 RepID=UPI003F9110FB